MPAAPISRHGRHFFIYKKRSILSRFDRFCPGKAQDGADGKENKPRQKRKIPSVKLGQPREPVGGQRASDIC